MADALIFSTIDRFRPLRVGRLDQALDTSFTREPRSHPEERYNAAHGTLPVVVADLATAPNIRYGTCRVAACGLVDSRLLTRRYLMDNNRCRMHDIWLGSITSIDVTVETGLTYADWSAHVHNE
ncbi:MAG: hypothetical protein P8173_16890 [Gammaproteobacteria bacterium]